MSSAEIAANPSKIELRNSEGLSATINPNGAYVEELTAPDGIHLLYPRQNVNGKDRGGVFACAPIFGPGDKVGLNQHGYGRNLAWQQVDQGDLSAIFRLDNPHLQDESLQQYKDCSIEMFVQLGSNDTSILTRLTITNNGQEGFVLSPAFHPYFPTLATSIEDVDIKLDEKDTVNYTAEELAGTQVLDSDMSNPLEINNGNQRIAISGNGLKVPVAWTDNPNEYFCIEPTANGAVTGRNAQSDLNKFMCAPGEEKQYTMTIRWEV